MSAGVEAGPPGLEAAVRRRPRKARELRRAHPLASMLLERLLLGVLTLLVVSFVIFAATEVLPGDAVTSVLQNSATPEQIHRLQHQLHLDVPMLSGYWQWLSGVLHGDLGTSLVSQQPVGSIVASRVGNSALIVAAGSLIGSVVGVTLGVLAAARRGGWLDHSLSLTALVVVALPEFVKAVLLVVVFATVALHVLPAVSSVSNGVSPFADPKALVLPVATLVLVIFPYIFRMTRGTMIEALESDYVEMALLKGVSRRRVLLVHALRNALGPIVQVVGLNLVYLAGGIVVVEFVFNYPGIGRTLVDAVSNRDIPVIQAVVLLLAGFYVLVNILADALALWATPRRRLPRSG